MPPNRNAMKILFGYLTTAYRGGTKYQLDIARAMPTAQVGFLTSNGILSYEDAVTAIGPIHRIAPSRAFFRRLAQLKALAKEYDVLYLNKATMHPAELCLVKLAGFRQVVFHSHATGKDTANPLALAVFHGLHRVSVPFGNWVADRKYACSVPAARWLFGKKGAETARVIPNGIDLAAYEFSPPVRQAKRAEFGLAGDCVVHVGAFSGVKNQGYLVEAFRVYRRSHPDATLVFLGDGELRQKVEQEAADLGASVRFLGQRSDVAQWMQAADLLVLPSLREGLPFVVVEAQAAGLPCLVTDTAAPECKITNLCDFISIQEPPEALSRRMEAQIQLPRRNTRRELTRAGYDLHTIAAQLEQDLGA